VSVAQLAFNGAQKIQLTPFPFPFVQVCGMLLHLYMFSAPVVIGAYIQNPIFGTVLSAASILGMFALNQTAEELEDPFGVDPNDLPLDTILSQFRLSIFALELIDRNHFHAMWDRLVEQQAAAGDFTDTDLCVDNAAEVLSAYLNEQGSGVERKVHIMSKSARERRLSRRGSQTLPDSADQTVLGRIQRFAEEVGMPVTTVDEDLDMATGAAVRKRNVAHIYLS